MAVEDSAFTRILNRLEDSDTGVATKTASEHVQQPPETRMLELVRTISDAQIKTAGATTEVTPGHSLEAMAKQAQEAEMEVLVKQSQFLGAALADGFMQRFAQYDTALADHTPKIASEVVPDSLEKAAALGYRKAVADMEKQAQDEYQRGYADQMKQVHKIASDIHYAGQSVAHNIIAQHRSASQK